MTHSPDLVIEWIDSFPISAYLSDAMEYLYSTEQATDVHTQIRHKEEGNKRRKFDTADRERIVSELEKHSHLLS